MEEGLLVPPPADDLPVREAGSWVENKLRILAAYFPAFGRACTRTRRWYYVDGLAGPGVNRVSETNHRLAGSPLIALRAEPAFHRCLFMDSLETNVRALRTRTVEFGPRAVTQRGDCNRDLVRFMADQVELRQPCLCLLDPEGAEVHWATVTAIADLERGQRYKVEQLILFPIEWLVRELPTAAEPMPGNIAMMDRVFPSDGWWEIYERRRAGELTPEAARTEYVRFYAAGLRDQLGYRHVEDRQILRHGRTGAPMYFLLFATDNETGRKIMRWCFDNVFSDVQPALPGLEPPGPPSRLEP